MAPALLIPGYAITGIVFYAALSATSGLLGLNQTDSDAASYFHSKTVVQLLLTACLGCNLAFYYKAMKDCLPIDDEVRTIVHGYKRPPSKDESSSTSRCLVVRM